MGSECHIHTFGEGAGSQRQTEGENALLVSVALKEESEVPPVALVNWDVEMSVFEIHCCESISTSDGG